MTTSAAELPLLKPDFERTATIIGLDAENLAKDVRKRRGTIFHPQSVRFSQTVFAVV